MSSKKDEGDPGEFHRHMLVVTDMDSKIRKLVRNMHIERRKISLLKDEPIMKRFKEEVI